MIIKIVITHDNEVRKFEFSGNYALETMFIKLAEKYFGVDMALKIEELFKIVIIKRV